VNRDQVESQLSAMYDGELPAAECELLSRRLMREEPLRAAWSRYAVIGAALRAEPVAQVRPDFARRVSQRLEEAAAGKEQPGRRRLRRVLGQWTVGAGVAASVAGVAILLLRQDVLSGQGSALPASAGVVASAPSAAPATPHRLAPLVGDATPSLVALQPRSNDEPASYVVPPSGPANSLAVPASLADYVVAHSEVSSPLVRRSLLSALVATESLEPAVMPAPGAQAPVAAAGEGREPRANGNR
jgi:sigma-E factor negative regulatory protein RseA